MIDDKKIEKAATVASISDTKKKCRVRDGYVINALADHESGFREGYIEGAKWAIDEFLKDLWHPVSEEPKESIFMLSEYEKGKFYANYFDKNRGGWSNKRLIRWLNIDDLLPKEGDNHD